MRRLLVQLLILTYLPNFVFSQTTIRFLPKNSLIKNENTTNQLGKIEQIGASFEGNVLIEFPEKTLKLNLVRSNIKQYKSITTSQGEIYSTVEIYEDCSKNEKYFVATNNKQFYSIYMLESGEFSSLENQKNGTANYIKNQKFDDTFSVKIDEDIVQSIPFSQKNNRNSNLSGCIEIPIGFVCDYAYYSLKADIAAIEANNLLKLAAANELFVDYRFQAKINFVVIGQIIYDKLGQTPWENEDINVSLSNLISENLKSKKPPSWENQRSLINVIITGRDYETKDIWGRGQNSLREFLLGSAVIKGFKDDKQTIWILTHELGHVFGASHSTSGSIMYPTFDGHGLDWSIKSSEEINTTLNTLNDNKWLKFCPTLQLSWEIEKDSIVLTYETNYDAIGDVFTIEYSTDNSKTWQKIIEIKSKNAQKYQFRIPSNKVYMSGNPIRIKQSGTNEITSNTINVIVTALEEKPSQLKSEIYIKNYSNELLINTLQPSDIIVHDVFGRKILHLESTKSEYLIDVKAWPRGVYYVKTLSNLNIIYKVFKEN